MKPKKYKLKRIHTQYIKKQIDESKFAINYQQELNPSQYEAVASVEGAYLIIAGAGTGKTRTLVYRVARLIESGYDPSSVLLLTFTRKAANEMMRRASVLLDDRCSKIRGGTFHSFANTTLRKYAKAIGLSPSFTILDQGDSADIINLIRSQDGFIDNKKRFPKKDTLNKIFSLSVNTNRKVQDIIGEDYPHFLPLTEKILEIQKVFISYKRKNNLLDYDDLLIYLRDFLFSNSAAVRALLSNIKFVMVDEYQDTNYIQSEIVKGLAQHNGNVMVVGDDAQSIYSFRGANFKNIMFFSV
ncbi:ATP-dependent helicase [Bacteroidota bacterium]